MSNSEFAQALSDIRQSSHTAPDTVAVQEFCVSRMAERLAHYNRTGLYILDRKDPGILVLGPFRGAPTEHVRIPVTEGICGVAIAHGNTVIADDVASDRRYLACSLETRSEIVVPIRVNDGMVGEIDIDSHWRRAFGDEDRKGNGLARRDYEERSFRRRAGRPVDCDSIRGHASAQ
jgi:L-methionine (R)-S-oxide reductase